VFRLLLGLARVGFLARAILLFTQGKPFALLCRVGMAGLSAAARAEERRAPVRTHPGNGQRHSTPVRSTLAVRYQHLPPRRKP
jgi:hypothetical protein